MKGWLLQSFTGSFPPWGWEWGWSQSQLGMAVPTDSHSHTSLDISWEKRQHEVCPSHLDTGPAPWMWSDFGWESLPFLISLGRHSTHSPTPYLTSSCNLGAMPALSSDASMRHCDAFNHSFLHNFSLLPGGKVKQILFYRWVY